MARKSYEFMFALAASMNSNFRSTFTTATKSVKTLKASFDDLTHIHQEVNTAFANKIINEQSFKNAQKQINLINRGLQKASATEMFQKSFIDVSAFYYGAKNIAMNFAEPVQAAMHFESVMADVKKVVDFDTPEQFRKTGDDITNLSKNIPMTAEELAKIVAAGGQSGIARQDLTAFAESAAKMGGAFDITAEQAGDMMAKWRTAFKMNQQDVVTLADKINYLGNTTAASAPLISDVVTRIGPLGAVGGLASGEIAAMGASLIGSGIQSEVAATGLKNFILAMTAGESATKKQNEAFAALGLNAQDMAERMQKDAKGAIIALLSSMKNLDAVHRIPLFSRGCPKAPYTIPRNRSSAYFYEVCWLRHSHPHWRFCHRQTGTSRDGSASHGKLLYTAVRGCRRKFRPNPSNLPLTYRIQAPPGTHI